MHCRHENGDEGDVGQLALGESDVMGYERCCADDHDSFQFVFVLWLQDEEQEADNVEHDERFVNHACANLIGIAGAKEVDGSYNG